MIVWLDSLIFEENSVKYKNGTRFFLDEDKCH